MTMIRIYAVFLRQIYIVRNLPSRVVPYFLWAALDIVLWGFITNYLNTVVQLEFSFVPMLLGAAIFWNFLQRVEQGMTIPFLEDVWTKNLLNMFASPLRLPEYVAGFIMAAITTSIAGLIVMLALAGLFFGFSALTLGFALIPFLLLLFLFGIVLGTFAAAIVLRFGPYAEWFIWAIPPVLSPFVGVFYPIAILPGWMQAVSYALPPSYVFEGMRAVVLSGDFQPTRLFIGFILSLAYLALAYGLFVSVYKVVVRRGMIARFSAEGA